MRKVLFLGNAIAVLGVYVFACGALNLPVDGENWSERFLGHVWRPFSELTPLSVSILAGGAVFFFCAALVKPLTIHGEPLRSFQVPWSEFLTAVLAVISLSVAVTITLLFSLYSNSAHPLTLGVLYAAAAVEGVIGLVVAVALLFVRRSNLAYVPTAGLLLVGVMVLGAVYWLGMGSPS